MAQLAFRHLLLGPFRLHCILVSIVLEQVFSRPHIDRKLGYVQMSPDFFSFGRV